MEKNGQTVLPERGWSQLEKLIDFEEYPVRPVLDILLEDKTTKQNIIWATDTYSALGADYLDTHHMTRDLFAGFRAGIIQPRIHRSREEQSARTKQKAEVFTPIWICNQMNNFCDEEWFGRKDVFNVQNGKERTTYEGLIEFSDPTAWKKYVDSRRLEITCGEAPFLVSRYDAATGEVIPIKDRIGILDRKLRVVTENAQTEEEWLEWTIRAFQSVYGYEYQGDSLLIARVNLLYTFTDYFKQRWFRKATKKELETIANIIAWNIWQMDGLTDTVPGGKIEDPYEQLTIFDMLEPEEPKPIKPEQQCKIYDWRSKCSVPFFEIKRGF